MENIENQILKDKRISFLSLGCKVNAYETEVFRERFEKLGAVIVPFEDGNADAVVINTCSVTNIADRKSRQMLHKARKLSPNAVIVAAGCYAQAVREKVVESGDADVLAGNDKKDIITELVAEALLKKDPKSACDTAPAYGSGEKEDFCHERTRAFIKVTDGCNQFCTYCIIPYVRGRVRSRDTGSIIEEAVNLRDKGYREVVLTGIHLSSYGTDLTSDPDAVPLLDLIDEVSKIDGIERIRLGSLEPRIITDGFVAHIADNPKVCPHFHLSLQSGSDTVLKRMNRHYTAEDYENACNLLRKAYELPSINTDIIVGFPGETEEEFNETMEFAKKIGFAKIHIFKYSRRKGTFADKMPGQVDEEIKTRRSEMLSRIDEANHINYVSGFVGKKVRILTEQEEVYDGKKYMTGLTERYVRVALDNRDCPQNVFVDCLVTGIIDRGVLTGVPADIV